MTKIYQNFKIIINLLFAIVEIVDKFIYYDVIHEMKDSFDYLLISIIFDLKILKKLKQRFKRN